MGWLEFVVSHPFAKSPRKDGAPQVCDGLKDWASAIR